MYVTRTGITLPPHSINIYTYDPPYLIQDGDLESDSFSTWNYDTNVYGITIRYAYEWYANEQDAINRFRELFLEYHTTAVPKSAIRRFIRILSTHHVVDEFAPLDDVDLADVDLADV